MWMDLLRVTKGWPSQSIGRFLEEEPSEGQDVCTASGQNESLIRVNITIRAQCEVI